MLVRVPGLVKPPSLVSSAADMLLLLQVEALDKPRRKDAVSASSSTGELVLECSAWVRSDSLRSHCEGLVFEKEALKESCSFSAEGLGVHSKSGGSSTSANNSSSIDITDAELVG